MILLSALTVGIGIQFKLATELLKFVLMIIGICWIGYFRFRLAKLEQKQVNPIVTILTLIFTINILMLLDPMLHDKAIVNLLGTYYLSIHNVIYYLAVLAISTTLMYRIIRYRVILQIQTFVKSTYRDQLKSEYLLILSIAAIVLIGWVILSNISESADSENKAVMLARTNAIATSIDPDRLATLQGSEADTTNEFRKQLSIILTSLCNSQKNTRYFYILGCRDTSVFFYVDAEPVAVKGVLGELARPGEYYPEATPELKSAFKTGKSFVEGPVRDHWGIWISALSPILDQKSNRVIAILGQDVDAKEWQSYLQHLRFTIIVVILLIVILIIVFFEVLHYNRNLTRMIASSERRYRTLVEGSNHCIALLNTDAIILSINQTGLKVFGTNHDDAIGTAFPNLWKDPDRRNIEDAIVDVCKGSSVSCQAEFVGENIPSTIWDIQFNPVIEESGSIELIVVMATEITQQKQAENALRIAEKKYRNIFEFSNEGIFQSTLEGKIITVNPAFARIFGFESPEQLIANIESMAELYVNPEQRTEIVREIFTSRHLDNLPIEIVRTSGEHRWVSLNAHGVFNSSTEVEYIEGSISDITERVNIEQILIDSEKKYRSILENIRDVYFRTDMNKILVMVSKSAGLLFGVDCIDPDKQVSISQFIANPEYLDQALEILHQVGVLDDYQIDVVTKDGKVVPSSVSCHYVLDEKGERIGVEGIMRDISERIRSEEQLRLSEKRFRDMAELLPQIIFEFNRDGYITYTNRAGHKVLGYSDEEIGTGIQIGAVIAPDSRERATANIRKMAGNPGFIPEGNEYNILHRDGTLVPMISYSVPIMENGVFSGVRGILVDITELKEAEQALRKSEELYRALIETSPDAIAMLDSTGNIQFVNQRMQSIFGAKQVTDLIGLNLSELISSSEFNRGNILISSLVDHHGIDKINLEFKRLDNSIFIGEIFISIVHDQQSNLKSKMTVIRDITQRIQAEEAIRESEKKYRELTDTLSEIVF